MKLAIDNLHFSYNSHPVLSGMRFSLAKGEILGVMGTNGAGKSTLIQCINRILKPSRGSVLVDGENLIGMKQNRVARRVGYVPQRHPRTRLTVFETVLMGRKPHMGWSMTPADYARTEAILEQFGLTKLAMRAVADLSGGEIQKVVVARALAQAPRVLLLDEPTSNLDLKNQLEVMGMIRDIVRDQGLSVVVAIHDLNIALRFADRFLFLKNARIHAAATRDNLTADTIRQVYGVDVALATVGGHTVVAPL